MDIVKQFQSPDRKYSVLAFWFLSGRLEKERLRQQIDEMVDKGVYGGFLHPRAYLETPYLEQEWWEAVGACMDEAKKTGFAAWLYDEYAWPSGTAGSTFEYGFQKPSRILAMGEQNMAKGLYARTLSPGEKAEEDRLLTVLERGGRVYAFYCRTYEKAVDYLNPDTIKEFIRLTHEEYKKRFGDGFGTWIPGIFFDEIFMMGNPFPWTGRLPERFLARFGYDLTKELVSLVEGDSPKDRQVRKDYFEMIATMYEEAFFRQISRWCAENHLCLTGHTEEFLWEHPRRQGNYFRTMRHLMIPGADCHDYRYRYPRKITFCEPKYAVSVARAYGRERAMSEALGGAGWNCTPEEMKRGINTLAAMGINLFILHGFYYECCHQGSQSDWPASFFYQNPYWRYFKCFSDYIRRICFLNSIGRPVVRYGLYYPIEWIQECMVDGEENPEGETVSRRFHDVLNGLIGRQMDVDMIDSDSLMAAEIRDGKLWVGQQRFELLLLPSGVKLEPELMEKLRRWEGQGGHLVFYRTSGRETADTAARLVCPDVRIVAGDRDEIYINHRETEESHLFFLCNSSRIRKQLCLEFRSDLTKGKMANVRFLDIETGRCRPGRWEPIEGTLHLSVTLEAAEAVYLVIDRKECDSGPCQEENHGAKSEEWIAGKWEFLPLPRNEEKRSMLLDLPLAVFASDGREGSRQIWISGGDGCFPDCVSLWEAAWITRRPSWNDQLDAADLYFCKDFQIDSPVTEANFCLAAIDSYQVYINGTLAAEGESRGEPIVFTEPGLICEGRNWIAVHVKNHRPIQEVHLCSAGTLPKDRLISLLLQGDIHTEKGCRKLISDHTWITSDQWEEGWQLPGQDQKVRYFDVQKIRNFNTESAGHAWIPAWERGWPPLLPWGDLPLFGKLINAPVNRYYTVTIPAGSHRIEQPETEGEACCYLDGKPIVWDQGWKDVWPEEEKHVLTIQVKSDCCSRGLKRPVRVVMKSRWVNLEDWQNCGLSWYSGSCRYQNSFTAEPGRFRYQLDLGRVHFCAELWVNGKPAGVRLWPPYIFDITEYLQDGENQITVIVSNLAGNERRHMLVEEGQALGWNRYWNEDNMDRESENYVSGLLGPVRLLKEEIEE